MDTPMPTEELLIRCLALSGASEAETLGVLSLIPEEIKQLFWQDWLEEHKEATVNDMIWAAHDLYKNCLPT